MRLLCARGTQSAALAALARPLCFCAPAPAAPFFGCDGCPRWPLAAGGCSCTGGGCCPWKIWFFWLMVFIWVTALVPIGWRDSICCKSLRNKRRAAVSARSRGAADCAARARARAATQASTRARARGTDPVQCPMRTWSGRAGRHRASGAGT